MPKNSFDVSCGNLLLLSYLYILDLRRHSGVTLVCSGGCKFFPVCSCMALVILLGSLVCSVGFIDLLFGHRQVDFSLVHVKFFLETDNTVGAHFAPMKFANNQGPNQYSVSGQRPLSPSHVYLSAFSLCIAHWPFVNLVNWFMSLWQSWVKRSFWSNFGFQWPKEIVGLIFVQIFILNLLVRTYHSLVF